MAKIVPHYNPEYRISFDVDETLVKMKDEKLVVHHKHIEAIKTHWYRGHHVRVHSAGGSSWANYVVKKLGLEEFVHEVVAKDRWYVDDLPADEWMDRYYIRQEGFNNGQSFGTHQKAIRDTEIRSMVSSVTAGGGINVYPIPTVQTQGLTFSSETS